KLVRHYHLEQDTGVLVAGIEPGSPAARAGLVEGDILIALDAHPTPRVEALHRLLTADRVGESASLTVIRGVDKLALPITPLEMPAAAGRGAGPGEGCRPMKRTASAVWQGDLKQGKGTLTVPSGTLKETPYSFRDRFESGTGTNPEELIAAAHA